MDGPGENRSSTSQSSGDLAAGRQTPDNRPSSVAGAGQPSILQFGDIPSLQMLVAGQSVTVLCGTGFNVVPLGNNLSILQTNGLHLPIIQTEGLQSLPGLPAGAKPTTSQTGSLQPQIFQPGRFQTSPVQIGAFVQSIGLQTQSLLGLQPSTVHISPTVQPILLQPQTFLPTDSQTQSTISSVVQSRGHLPFSYEVATQTTSMKQVSRLIEGCRKEASKSQCKMVTNASSVPKVKRASNNTVNINKSIGTLVNSSLRNRIQGVQGPEGGNSNFRTLQTFQKDQTIHSSQVGVKDSHPSLQGNAMFLQETGALENVLHAQEVWQADKLFLQDLLRIRRHSYMFCEPGQIRFDDVAIYFSKDEWEYLTKKDKDLYMEMMVNNYCILHSLGWITVKPPLITMIEQGEDIYVKYPKQFENPHIPGLTSRGMKNVNSIEENYNLHKFSEHLRKIIDGFLTTCIEQTEHLLSETTANVSESGPFCQVNPLLAQKPAIDEKPFKCRRCERSYKRFTGLLLHQKSHRFENGFSCFQCSKTFKSTKTLIQHELIHTREKPFICPRCGKRFSSQKLLDVHLGIPLKKNPFVCLQCGKRFAKQYILRKHEMIHNLIKPFVCFMCGKDFTEEEDFNEHQKIHIEEHMQ